MIGKPRPISDRASSELGRAPASGALTGLRTAGKPAKGTRVSRFLGFARASDPAVNTLRSAAADAQKSRIPQMAAALAYRTIFGLLPVLVVALVLVKAFWPEKVRDLLQESLEYTGIAGISVRDPIETGEWSEDFMGPPPPGAVEPVVAPPAAGLIADAQGAPQPPALEVPAHAMEDWISTLLNRIDGVSFATIGIPALIFLIYAALAMLVEMERAFNQIYRVPRGRSWVRRVMQYWTILTLGPTALVATFLVGQEFAGKVQAIAASRGVEIGSGAVTVTVIGYLVTVAISTCFFLIAYVCVPNTKVRIWPALVGAFCAAVMWEAGKWGFTQYLHYTTNYARLYGALALLPLFLLWVYITWLIVLFGLEIAYQLQHGRARTRAQPFAESGPAMVDPTAALVVLAAVARSFESGRPEDAPALARSTGLPEPVVRLVVNKLSERALLHRIDSTSDDAEPAYALARAPTSIRAAEILELGYELAGTATADEAVVRLHRAQIDSVGDQSLAELAGLGRAAPPAPPSAPPPPPRQSAQTPPESRPSAVRTGENGNQPDAPVSNGPRPAATLEDER